VNLASAAATAAALLTCAPSSAHCWPGKGADENLFDLIDPQKVNKHLQELMPGLTIKVFRTYNASITLSDLLKTTDASLEVAGKKAAYDEANKEVAILCNHQKGVSKNHDAAMGKLVDKKKALQEELREASGGAAAKLRYGWERCVCCPVVLCLTALPHLPQGAHRDIRPGHAVQGVVEDGVAGHQQDQLLGPAHHSGLVQGARGAHRENLHQGLAGQVQRACRRTAPPPGCAQLTPPCVSPPSQWSMETEPTFIF
jgi:hypothetical protein